MSASPVFSRILERAHRASVAIEPGQVEKLAQYYMLLERWNKKINLTALPLADFPDATLDRLLIEPLLAASHVPDAPLNWIDFGSGGGSPAVPLKVLRPQAALTMVEAKERKSAFLREIVGNLALSCTAVLTSRVEDMGGSELRTMADLVTVRALRVDELLLDSAHRLLRPGGRVMCFRSKSPTVFNDLRFISMAEVTFDPLEGGLTMLQKRA